MRPALVCLVLLAACASLPPPARDAAAPHDPLFSPSARVKVVVLAPEDRGAGPDRPAQVQAVLVAELTSGRRDVEVVLEREIPAFRDAGARRRLLGDGGDAALGRAAVRLGADRLVTGWVGRSGARLAFHLRAVGPDGRTAGHDAGVVDGAPSALFARVRRGAAALLFGVAPEAPVRSDAGRRRALARRAGAFEACLAEGVMAEPALSGEATVSLVVDASGAVRSAAVPFSTLASDPVETCLTAAAGTLRLPPGPAPEGPVTFRVRLPLPGASEKGTEDPAAGLDP